MPETVCVTVEQLKRLYDSTGCCATDCYSDEGEDCTCGYVAIGNAIAQADGLEEWRHTLQRGDGVRLKAWPEAGKWKVLEISEGSLGMKAWLVSAENKRPEMQRYLAELMPEEE